MPSETIATQVYSAFAELSYADDAWDALVRRSRTNEIFMTRSWQETWWEVFQRGKLVLVVAEREGAPAAIAPFFYDGGMLFLVGSGGSDYLDLIGESLTEEVVTALLEAARASVEGFVGFRFYHVPDHSPTGRLLQRVAASLDLRCFDEGLLPAPALQLSENPRQAQAAASKTSLLRHERRLARLGTLRVRHTRDGAEVLPQLEAFFDQHIRRWRVTPFPSLFENPGWREFYRAICRRSDVPWLRFSCVEWNDQPVAFHFGSCYAGRFLWYKPSFEIELAQYSPGEVLLRHLLLAAIDEGARDFDFGLGDEPFKQRFATRTDYVRTWGLYPREPLP